MDVTGTTINKSRLSLAMKHIGYLSEVLESMNKCADHRGMLILDGSVRQRICGKFNIHRDDLHRIVQLGMLYGFLKYDPRTKHVKIELPKICEEECSNVR